MNTTKLLFTLAIVFISLLAVLYLVTNVSLPGNNRPTVASRTEFTYWGINLPVEVIQPLISEYEKSNPNVLIKYERKSYADLTEYKKLLAEKLRSGEGPDIFRIHATWSPFLSSEMAINTSVSKKDFEAAFYRAYRTQCIINEEVKCIPIMYDGLALAYNKDLFQQSGAGVPVTWEDFRNAAIRITKRDSRNNIIVAGAAIGSTNNVANHSDIISLMLAQSNIKIPDSIDSETAVEVIGYYMNFSKIDRVWSDSLPDSIGAFAEGKVGMVFVKTGDLKTILNLNPSMNLEVISVPQLPLSEGGTTRLTVASSFVETVSTDLSKDEQKLAWDFLNWLSMPEQQTKMFSEYSKYANFGEIPSVKSLDSITKSNEYLQGFIEYADSSSHSYFTTNSGNKEFIDVFNNLAIAIGENDNSLYKIFSAEKEKIRSLFRTGF